MGNAHEPSKHMDRRALLTEREREVLRGDAADVDNLEQYQSKVRSRLRNRVERLEEDIELLDAVEAEIADDIRQRICDDHASRLDHLEQEIADLREQLNE